MSLRTNILSKYNRDLLSANTHNAITITNSNSVTNGNEISNINKEINDLINKLNNVFCPTNYISFGGNPSSIEDDGKYFELNGKASTNLTPSNINTVFVSTLNCSIYSISWIKENDTNTTIGIIKNENEINSYTYILSGTSGVIKVPISIDQGDRIEVLYKNESDFPGNMKLWIQLMSIPININNISPSFNNIHKNKPPGDDWSVFNSHMYINDNKIQTNYNINII